MQGRNGEIQIKKLTTQNRHSGLGKMQKHAQMTCKGCNQRFFLIFFIFFQFDFLKSQKSDYLYSMRKTIFFSPIFLFLCGGIFISCHFLADISTEERVKILFPDWPPVEMDGGGDMNTGGGNGSTGVSKGDTEEDNGRYNMDSGASRGDTRAGPVDTEACTVVTRMNSIDTEEGNENTWRGTENTEVTPPTLLDTSDATRSVAENTTGTPPKITTISPATPTSPPLSRWKIIVSTIQDSKTFYTTDSCLEWTFQKNQPASVTIQPITLLEDGRESEYFYPAGFVYPAAWSESSLESTKDSSTSDTTDATSSPENQTTVAQNFSAQTATSQNASANTSPAVEIENGQVQATWEQGFLSEILRRAISSKNETGVSDSRLADFLSSFNWQKAQKTIREKLENSLENETEACFNPWQIDSSHLLDNLCYGNFKISYLNVTECQTYLLSELFDDDFLPISPFIPENQVLYEKGKIKIKKNTAVLIGDGHKNAFVFYCKSAKNISRDIIYMPIYRERL